MEQQWYIAKGKQKLGPFSIEQMQQMAAKGELLKTEMVLGSNQKKWCLAETVENIFTQIKKDVVSPSILPPPQALFSLINKPLFLIGTIVVHVALLCGFF